MKSNYKKTHHTGPFLHFGGGVDPAQARSVQPFSFQFHFYILLLFIPVLLKEVRLSRSTPIGHLTLWSKHVGGPAFGHWHGEVVRCIGYLLIWRNPSWFCVHSPIWIVIISRFPRLSRLPYYFSRFLGVSSSHREPNFLEKIIKNNAGGGIRTQDLPVPSLSCYPERHGACLSYGGCFDTYECICAYGKMFDGRPFGGYYTLFGRACRSSWLCMNKGQVYGSRFGYRILLKTTFSNLSADFPPEGSK